ncbi:response regulator [bacterium]|nr:response regulator [bacterium]MBU1920838.1 response regulator [bacterium]
MKTNTEVKPHRILLVDDDPNVIASLKRLLHWGNYTVDNASDGRQAIEMLREKPADLIICDEQMPGPRGIQVLRYIREQWPETVRIMLTGCLDTELALRAVNEGEAYRLLAKPWNDADLLVAIKQGLEYGDLVKENRKLADEMRKYRNTIASIEEQFPGITSKNIDTEGYYVASE